VSGQNLHQFLYLGFESGLRNLGKVLIRVKDTDGFIS
jgi:hypothetical protein